MRTFSEKINRSRKKKVLVDPALSQNFLKVGAIFLFDFTVACRAKTPRLDLCTSSFVRFTLYSTPPTATLRFLCELSTQANYAVLTVDLTCLPIIKCVTRS